MTITLPKLRLPSWTEFLAMFHVSTEVDKIVAGLKRAEEALAAAVFHHADLADVQARIAADAKIAEAAAKAEMSRAARVVDNIRALIA